jgi:hypothetical protein
MNSRPFSIAKMAVQMLLLAILLRDVLAQDSIVIEGPPNLNVSSRAAASPTASSSSSSLSHLTQTTDGSIIQGFTSFSTTTLFTSISEASVSPSPTIVVSATPSPSKTNKLPTGAKAGIGVGVTLSALVLIALIIAILWHRGRRHLTQREEGQRAYTEPKPNTYEMITDSNRHELLTKSNVHEMEQEKQGVLSAAKELQGQDQPTETHELNPNSHILGPELHSDGYPSLHEIETTSAPAVAVATDATISNPRSQVSRNEVAEEEDEEGMRVLQDRIKRIRAEKERLQKIQELELLEEETKRAILEKVRRRGGGSGSGNG